MPQKKPPAKALNGVASEKRNDGVKGKCSTKKTSQKYQM